MDDVAPQLKELFARARSAEEFVGLSEEEARRRAKSEGVDQVRIFLVGTQMAFHADHRPKRLNLVVRDGSVILAAFF